MAMWAAMSCMQLLLGGNGGRKYSNMSVGGGGGGHVAAAGRFHPDIGGHMSIIRGGGLSQSQSQSLINFPSPSKGKSSPTLPLLMVPPEMVSHYNSMGATQPQPNNNNIATHFFNFMTIEKQLGDGIHKKLFMVDNKTNTKLPPVPDDAFCRGSSHGWLAYIKPTTCQLGLFNPLSSLPHYIPLPCSEPRICNICKKKYIRILKKMALSCPPSLLGGDCNVVGINESCGYKGLVFCNLGDSTWTNLKGFFHEYSDLIYFTKHGLFYAVPKFYYDEPFNIESWDFTDPCSITNTLIEPSRDRTTAPLQFPSNPQGWRAKNTPPDELDFNGMYKRYLVEASGDLLLVIRNIATEIDKDGFLIPRNDEGVEFRSHITLGFAVFKMDWSENKWNVVESMGDKALFLGINHSFSVSTKDLPGIMPNSIYFTDDMDTWFHPWGYESGYDSGVYNMDDGFISGILPSTLEEIDDLPVWVLPNPN